MTHACNKIQINHMDDREDMHARCIYRYCSSSCGRSALAICVKLFLWSLCWSDIIFGQSFWLGCFHFGLSCMLCAILAIQQGEIGCCLVQLTMEFFKLKGCERINAHHSWVSELHSLRCITSGTTSQHMYTCMWPACAMMSSKTDTIILHADKICALSSLQFAHCNLLSWAVA